MATFTIGSAPNDDFPALLNGYLSNEVAADRDGVLEYFEISSMSEYTIISHFNLKLEATYGTKQLCDVVTEAVPKTANVQKGDYFDLFIMAYSLNFVAAN